MGSLLRFSTPTVLPSSNRRSPLAVLGGLRSAASEFVLKRLVIPAFVLILLKVVVGLVRLNCGRGTWVAAPLARLLLDVPDQPSESPTVTAETGSRLP